MLLYLSLDRPIFVLPVVPNHKHAPSSLCVVSSSVSPVPPLGFFRSQRQGNGCGWVAGGVVVVGVVVEEEKAIQDSSSATSPSSPFFFVRIFISRARLSLRSFFFGR